MSPHPAARYSAVAVVLHWAIAAAIVANFALGWWMHEAIDEADRAARAIAAFQLHKSIGLTILALSLLRLAWRLAHRPPPLPARMLGWERLAARAVHWAFYGLMVAVPLSGWLYASLQWREDAPLAVPTLWFGQFQVPHLFGLDELPARTRYRLAERFEDVHEWLAWATVGLLALHVGAALKHRFVDRDGVLASMAPRAGLAIATLTLAAIVAAAFVAPRQPGAAGDIRGAPGGWIVDPASEIAFAGTHAGVPFRGRFTRWQADLRFNPLAASPFTIAATVETGSATDGVPLHDETLPLPEWFDVARHPEARFAATRIAPRPGGGHTIEGALTLKDRVIPVPPLDLVLDGDAMRIEGRFTIDRAQANLGMESDPSGEYVSRRIQVEVRVLARRPAS
jgi:cytochrome b561/polyisoprenoid-binding protein YceI